ncbi:MAG: MFS transporter, partial [Anaerolineae bacterium]
MENGLRQHLRHNVIVNLLDGGFFGFAVGIASFVTVIPLFVNQMSNSVLLIGLIPAIHSMGWQLPQLLTGHRVTRLTRYKPMVLWMTLHERLPFIGLAVVAFLLPRLGNNPALVLTYLLLIWQGLGGGFTATAWQSMIGKVIPPKLRGTFYGMQSATANLFAAVGAFIAGLVLQNLPTPTNFVICFLVAGGSMTFSLIFLGQTREPAHVPENRDEAPAAFWNRVRTILRTDGPFRQFMLARIMLQFAGMAFSFYIIYIVQTYNAPPETTGLLTTVFLATQIIANPVMGWIGDHSSQLIAMLIGVGAAGASVLIALFAPDANWFYPVLVLAGIANVGMWTASLAMTLEFGSEGERPAYIGLTNTLLAPVTILTPVLGGWLAEKTGYSTTFGVSLLGAAITAAILGLMLWQRK